MKLDIANGVSLDLMRLVDSRMLISANSGGGKSWLLRLLAEKSAGHVQTIILDPEGEFATLRERFDFLLVGREGEIPAEPRTAALLARRLMELQASAIIGLYDLKLPDRRRFVKLFLDELLSLPKSCWHPLLVMIDEAHLFCPERSAGDAESTDAVINLMSLGRKRSFCGVLSTQRLSKLHKDAEAEANNVFLGRTWMDIDQKRAGALLGFDKKQAQDLRDLENEFFAFGPALDANGVIRFKPGPVVTTHPKAGQRHKLTPPKASVAVRRIMAELEDLPKEAEEEARDLNAARAKIAELQRELRARPTSPAVEKIKVQEKRVEIPVLNDGQLNRLNTLLERFENRTMDLQTGLFTEFAELRKSISAATYDPAKMTGPHLKPTSPAAAAIAAKRSGTFPPAATQNVPPQAKSSGPAAKGQQGILDTLAWLESVGVFQTSRNIAAFLAGQSPTSSTYQKHVRILRDENAIEYPGPEQLKLTDVGRERATPTETPLTPAALHEAIYKKLPAKQTAMLQQLIRVYPEAFDRSAIADLTSQSPTSSTFEKHLRMLRDLGFVRYPTPGQIAATPALFLEGQ